MKNGTPLLEQTILIYWIRLLILGVAGRVYATIYNAARVINALNVAPNGSILNMGLKKNNRNI